MSKKTIKHPRELKRGTLVLVRTLDIEHDDFGWESVDVIAKRKPGTYSLVGWVVADHKHHIVIASVISSHGSTFCSVKLPKGAGMKVTRLA